MAFLLAPSMTMGMDRWHALALIESGGRDQAIGRKGEISRYQIRPELWPGGNPLDAHVALVNAQYIMAPRVARFERAHGRPPDDLEFYVLWNAPAQVRRPHRAVIERARRFVNLVAESDSSIGAFDSAASNRKEL